MRSITILFVILAAIGSSSCNLAQASSPSTTLPPQVKAQGSGTLVFLDPDPAKDLSPIPKDKSFGIGYNFKTGDFPFAAGAIVLTRDDGAQRIVGCGVGSFGQEGSAGGTFSSPDPWFQGHKVPTSTFLLAGLNERPGQGCYFDSPSGVIRSELATREPQVVQINWTFAK